jgi:RHS repeat-associated protein
LGEYTANNSNITSKEYVYLGDTPIAVVQAGNILTVQTDHLDTPRQLTDNTKKIVWNWAYSAFGENQPTTTNNTVFNLRYPGQYYDAESKLHYNINRYYDPATGRYTQSDPIGLSGGINTYTYVGGNSIRYVDKSGLNAVASGYAGAGVGTAVFPGIGTVVGGVVGLGVGIWATDAAIDAGLDAYANYKNSVNDTSAQQNSDDSDDITYPDNPDSNRDKFDKFRKGFFKCKKDNSVWDRDGTNHGGQQWKRWRDEKSLDRGDKPTSIWPNGRVRK